MARPEKLGIEYFPLDVDIDQDDKIMLIEAAHGIIGFGVVVKILMKIYKEGYFYEWTEREQLLFSKRVNVDINQVNVIINDCLKWRIFDKQMYDKYSILTSKGIQRRYLEAVSRRKKVEMIKQLVLISQSDLQNYKNIVYVDINQVNVDINTHSSVQNADIGTQSKVKESKVKESIKRGDTLKKFFDNVYLSKSEYNNLIDKLGKLKADEYIKRLNNYSFKNPKRFREYSSHYHVIMSWYDEDKQKEDKQQSKRRTSKPDNRDWEKILGVD